MKASELKKKYGLNEVKKQLFIVDNFSTGNDSFVSDMERMIGLYDLVCQDGKEHQNEQDKSNMELCK
jgi:hypothetical protein